MTSEELQHLLPGYTPPAPLDFEVMALYLNDPKAARFIENTAVPVTIKVLKEINHV